LRKQNGLVPKKSDAPGESFVIHNFSRVKVFQVIKSTNLQSEANFSILSGSTSAVIHHIKI